MSAPTSDSRPRRSAFVDVPITRLAPRCLPICIAMMPTPLLAPWTSMVWPGSKWPLVTIASCMMQRPEVRPATSSSSTPLAGTGSVRCQCDTAYSAQPAAPVAETMSPTEMPSASSPTATTSPVNDAPMIFWAPPTWP